MKSTISCAICSWLSCLAPILMMPGFPPVTVDDVVAVIEIRGVYCRADTARCVGLKSWAVEDLDNGMQGVNTHCTTLCRASTECSLTMYRKVKVLAKVLTL